MRNPICAALSALEISDDPISSMKRLAHVACFGMLDGQVILECWVQFLDANDEIIVCQRYLPYKRELFAVNGTRVDMQGNVLEKIEGETQEDFEARSVGEFDLFVLMLSQPVIVQNLIISAVQRADTRGMFDI